MLRTAPLLLVCAALAPAADPKPTFTKEQVTFYADKVAPILKENCLKCHGENPKKLKGGFDLRTRAAVLSGGDTGPAAVVGKPKESLLVLAINHAKKGYAMPSEGAKLKPDEIAVLTKWVTDGLPVPPDMIGEPSAGPKKKEFTAEQKAYWAYQSVKRPDVPKGEHPIDALLNTKLAAKGLKPLPAADKAVLVRRAYYDLTGLPPTPEQTDEFVKDADPKAWEKLIDTLLASPRYGEKWGKYWLDVVRFAETNGYERDGPKPNAWRFRDYVIRSFNADKPYDRFVKEQIAGDEMKRGEDEVDPVIATGYYRLGTWDDEPVDPLQAKFDGYDDIVSITGQAFLGMTLNCARCHDHKGDPILQEDYYRLVAFVRDIREFSNDRNVKSATSQTDITAFERRKVYEKELAEREEKVQELTKKMVVIEDAAIKKMPAEDQRASEGLDRPLVVKKVPGFLDADGKKEYAALGKERDGLKAKPTPPQDQALSVNKCEVNPPATFVNIRGNPHANGAEVKPAFPEVLGLPQPTIPAAEKGAKSSGRRTVLADWIADKKNPLTPRVMMNRLWGWHFGKGLVPTPNDFGKFGEQPTHPELLDWLAAEFVEPTSRDREGAESKPWTLKRMHRLIMTSAAYQRSSSPDATNGKTDPANTYLWKFNPRRLTSEEVRDSILAASGNLSVKTVGGPSMYPKLSAEVLAGISFGDKKNHWPDSTVEEQNRRTVYAFVKRSIQVPLLINHDQADTDNSCPVRYTTTVPTQALGMLNGEFTNEQADLLAKRMAKDAGDDVSKQVARGIRLTTGRVPDKVEVEKDVAFIDKLKTKHKLTDAKTLQQYALLLLNANEFVYVD